MTGQWLEGLLNAGCDPCDHETLIPVAIEPEKAGKQRRSAPKICVTVMRAHAQEKSARTSRAPTARVSRLRARAPAAVRSAMRHARSSRRDDAGHSLWPGLAFSKRKSTRLRCTRFV